VSFLLVAQRALTVPGWVKNALWRAAKTTPSLDLPFADSKSLVDAITGRQLISFARASSGTYTDSAGVLSTAVTNLVLGSADFSATHTALGNVTVSSDATVAPDGSLTADSVAGTSSTLNIKNWYKAVATTNTGTYTASVYLKADTQSIVLIRVNDNTGINGARQLINLSTGALLGGVGTDGTATGASSTISNAGNGWYRCTVTCTFNSALTSLQGPAVYHDGYTTSTSTKNYFAWGAQLEQSSTVGEYIPTGSTINSAPRFDHRITSTTTNLAIRSEEFDNATWVRTGLNAFGSGSVANAIAAPDGTVTGDLIEEDTSTGFHRVSQTLISGTISTGTYTASVYVKAAQRSRAYISLDDNATGEVTAGFATLTQAFTITTAGSWSGSTASIEDVGNGWFRISLTSTKGDGSSALTLRVGIAQVNVTTISYTGNGTAGLYVWGAQLVASDSNGRYVRTTAAAASFSTTESLGLLVEEQRTNLLLRSEEINDVAWTTLALNATVSANQTTAPNGATTADSIADDAVNNVHYIGQSVAVAAATTYTFSCFLRAGTSNFGYLSLSGGGPGWGDTFVVNLSTGVGNVQAGSFGSTSIQAFADGWYRVVVTKITTGSGSPQLRIGVAQSLSVTSYSGSGNTIFAWGAQLEAGATASSYIPTTTAAATRNADVVSITGTNFSSWYRQDEGTFYYEGTISQGLAGFPWLYSINDGTTSNDIGIYQFTNGVYGYTISGGVAATPDMSVLFSPVPGSLAKHALAVKTADSRAALNAALSVAQASTVMPVVNTLNIGRRTTGNRMTGTIRRLTYWPQALPGQLQAITQP
jgi:hypothetical protein